MIKWISGRFIDCSILWLEGIFHAPKNDPMDAFWFCLSSSEYVLYHLDIVFYDEIRARVWSKYLDYVLDDLAGKQINITDNNDKTVEASKGYA